MAFRIDGNELIYDEQHQIGDIVNEQPVGFDLHISNVSNTDIQLRAEDMVLPAGIAVDRSVFPVRLQPGDKAAISLAAESARPGIDSLSVTISYTDFFPQPFRFRVVRAERVPGLTCDIASVSQALLPLAWYDAPEYDHCAIVWWTLDDSVSQSELRHEWRSDAANDARAPESMGPMDLHIVGRTHPELVPLWLAFSRLGNPRTDRFGAGGGRGPQSLPSLSSPGTARLQNGLNDFHTALRSAEQTRRAAFRDLGSIADEARARLGEEAYVDALAREDHERIASVSGASVANLKALLSTVNAEPELRAAADILPDMFMSMSTQDWLTFRSHLRDVIAPRITRTRRMPVDTRDANDIGGCGEPELEWDASYYRGVPNIGDGSTEMHLQGSVTYVGPDWMCHETMSASCQMNIEHYPGEGSFLNLFTTALEIEDRGFPADVLDYTGGAAFKYLNPDDPDGLTVNCWGINGAASNAIISSCRPPPVQDRGRVFYGWLFSTLGASPLSLNYSEAGSPPAETSVQTTTCADGSDIIVDATGVEEGRWFDLYVRVFDQDDSEVISQRRSHRINGTNSGTVSYALPDHALLGGVARVQITNVSEEHLCDMDGEILVNKNVTDSETQFDVTCCDRATLGENFKDTNGACDSEPVLTIVEGGMNDDYPTTFEASLDLEFPDGETASVGPVSLGPGDSVELGPYPVGTTFSGSVSAENSNAYHPCSLLPRNGTIGADGTQAQAFCLYFPNIDTDQEGPCHFSPELCITPPFDGPDDLLCYTFIDIFTTTTGYDTDGDGEPDNVTSVSRRIVGVSSVCYAVDFGVKSGDGGPGVYNGPVLGLSDSVVSIDEDTVRVYGHTMDADGIASLSVMVDGIPTQPDQLQMNRFNADLCGADWPEGLYCDPNSQFSFDLGIAALAEGPHTIKVLVRDDDPLWRQETTETVTFAKGSSGGGGTQGVDDSLLVYVDAPTEFQCAEPATAELRVRNVGTTTWTRGGGLALAALDEQGLIKNSVRIPNGRVVVPNEAITFSVPFRAPFDGGPFQTSWRMLRENGSEQALFGPTFSVHATATQCSYYQLSPQMDASVSEQNPNQNLGAIPFLNVRAANQHGSGYGFYSFLRFPAPPSSSEIFGGQLCIRSGSEEIGNLGVYSVIGMDWDESDVTWNNWADSDPAYYLVADTHGLGAAQQHCIDVSSADMSQGFIDLGLTSGADAAGQRVNSRENGDAPTLRVYTRLPGT